MASREKQKKDTNTALWAAFDRLKKGEPEILKGDYKINPTTVQKEASRPYGTINGHPDVKKAVEQYKRKEEAKKKGLASEVDLLKEKMRVMRKKLDREIRAKNDYRAEKEAAETALKEESERTVSLVASLLELVPTEYKMKATDIVNTRKGNVVKLSPRRRE